MPTQRFNNLSEEKKERITQAIVYEFATKGIDETDISDIVKRAEIPRGSFYQYFADKDDAIMYIIHRIKKDKLAYLADMMEQAPRMTFIDFYYSMLLRGLKFAEDHPDYIPIGAYIMTSKNKAIQEFIQKGMESFYPFFEQMIDRDKKEGQMRADINNQAVILLVTNATSDMVVKLLYEQHEEFGKIKAIFDEVFRVIKRGISKGE